LRTTVIPTSVWAATPSGGAGSWRESCWPALSKIVLTFGYGPTGLLARREHSDRLTAVGTESPAPPSASIPEDGYLGVLSRHGRRLLSTYE
jgi:hypothetical protein